MRVRVVRHPPVALTPGTCYGSLDPLWSQAGAEMAGRLTATLGAWRPDRVFTSPAKRCRLLAGAIDPSATSDERLRELDFGVWEGRRWDDISRDEIDRWARDPLLERPPGGETGAALIGRVQSFAGQLAEEDVPRIAVVTHGGPMKLLVAMLRGEVPDLMAVAPPQGAIVEISLAPR